MLLLRLKSPKLPSKTGRLDPGFLAAVHCCRKRRSCKWTSNASQCKGDSECMIAIQNLEQDQLEIQTQYTGGFQYPRYPPQDF